MTPAKRLSSMQDRVGDRRERLHDAVEDGRERFREGVREGVELIKPHLRGWLHAVTFPLTVAAGIVLFVLSPTPETRIGSGVFAATAMLLFGCSALFHRGRWSPRT
jgi:hemolysin III